MKLCAKHWEKLMRSFGHEDVTDVKARLTLVTADYNGGDPWFAASTVVLFQELLKRVNADDYGGEPARVQEAVDKAGGCPVCFMDEKLLEDTVTETKEVMARIRPKSPS